MAIEDTLDQLYALYIANSVLCARMWGYIGAAAAKAEGISEQAFMEKHRKMSHESVELWDIGDHPRADHIKTMAREAVDQALGGINKGAPAGSRVQ